MACTPNLDVITPCVAAFESLSRSAKSATEQIPNAARISLYISTSASDSRNTVTTAPLESENRVKQSVRGSSDYTLFRGIR
jgi:hypothetical protein